MTSAEGAGRNFLAVLCCNYYFVKIAAEPFLNTSRGVQDLADCSSECVTQSRSRMSCTDLLSSYTAVINRPTPSERAEMAAAAALSGDGGMLIGDGVEAGSKLLMDDEDSDEVTKKYLSKKHKYGTLGALLSTYWTWLAASHAGNIISRIVHFGTIILSFLLILVIIYAAFTV